MFIWFRPIFCATAIRPLKRAARPPRQACATHERSCHGLDPLLTPCRASASTGHCRSARSWFGEEYLFQTSLSRVRTRWQIDRMEDSDQLFEMAAPSA